MSTTEPREPGSPYLNQLRNRLDLVNIPFSDRSSRIMLFQSQQGLGLDALPAPSFYIRLAERWVKQYPEETAYRRRPPIVQDLMLTNLDGQPLPFELTTYPHKLMIPTPLGLVQIAFLDPETLYFSLPEQPIGIHFRVQAERADKDRRGGTFHGVRNTAYTFNRHLRENTIVLLPDGLYDVWAVGEGGPDAAMVLNISPRLGSNRTVQSPATVMAAAEKRWHDWFAAAPPVLPQYERQYYYAWWVMRSGLISPRFYMTREGMTPSKIEYVGVWQWDAFFHALAYRHVDMRLAEDQVRLVLDHQRADGLIPDAIHDEGVVTHLTHPFEADVTKPPLVAWTAMQLFQMSQNCDFLDEIYEPVVRWNRWWYEYNDDDHDGLCQYTHPFSSGLDDSPLWDEGMPVEPPDLNTYLYWQQESLAQMAYIIGEKKDVHMWRQRARQTARKMVEQMWDEQAGLFWALRRGPEGKQPVRVLTPFSLYPLGTGRLSKTMEERLIAHLKDPDKFWTRYPLATVARGDPKFDPYQMWRGPTWVNINYLFCVGLDFAGYHELASELRGRTLDLIMLHNDIYEYYHPETGAHPPKAASLFGWSSALFIDMAIRASQENVGTS